MTTLAWGVDSITIPDDLTWSDEFAWSSVEQNREYTVTGSLIVEFGTRLAGRPITLRSEGDAGWITRTTLLALYTALNYAGQEFALTLRGVAHDVIFESIEAEPVLDYADPAGGDFYTVTLKFISV